MADNESSIPNTSGAGATEAPDSPAATEPPDTSGSGSSIPNTSGAGATE